MSIHEYTPEQALDTLMHKLRESDEQLAAAIQAAIDTGKDVIDSGPSGAGGKKPRQYRRTVPYTHQEALKVALDALQAYFIEQPLFANSCAMNFATTTIGSSNRLQPLLLENLERISDVPHHSQYQARAIVIELQTETQISRGEQQLFEFSTVSEGAIGIQRENLLRLRQLTDFNRGHSGDSSRS